MIGTSRVCRDPASSVRNEALTENGTFFRSGRMRAFLTLYSIPGFALALAGCFLSTVAKAEDHFLVIAGGQAAARNQVSLEKNVIFFRKVLEDTVPNASLTEHFSSGNAEIRSIQFESADTQLPAANIYMARLFGSTDFLKLQYRSHELGEVDGITSPANVNRWFDEKRGQLKSGDRLVIYVTAHGGRSRDKQKPHNSRIFMWARQSLDARALQGNLKTLPDGVTVVLVMAQCYSGGFAHSIFQETDPKLGDIETPVCGFFATVNTRESAGCTPDINEENYDEFTSHFWAAIRGQTRMGKPVEGADCDGDGMVSFNEAWAYTILTSRNIDIPMKTSGAFLRARSHFKGDEGVQNENLLKQQSPYSKVLELADSVEKKILEGLSEHLELAGESRYAAVEEMAGGIEQKRAELKRQLDQKKQISDGHRHAIRDTLFGRWPELSNIHTEQAAALVSEQADGFVEVVKNHPRREAWDEVGKEREAIEAQRFQLEKEWAHCVRFLRTHNNVVLAENLRILGNSDDVSRFESLRSAENSGLVAPDGID